MILFCSDPGTSENIAPKKRRRKESSTYLETNTPVDYFGDVPGKSSGRGTVQAGKQLASSSIGSYGQYPDDDRVVKNKTSGPGGALKRKSDFSADATARAKISKEDYKDVLLPLDYGDKELLLPLDYAHKSKSSDMLLPVDYAHKSKTSETYDYGSAYRDKGTSVQLDFQQRKASRENHDSSNRIYRKGKCGTSEYPVVAMGSAVYSTQTVVGAFFSVILFVGTNGFNPLLI